MKFSDRLIQATREKKTPLIVGIDPRLASLPAALKPDSAKTYEQQAERFEIFGKAIIDVVHSLVPAVKPQAAFFEMLGPPGMTALFNVVRYAKAKGLLVIMDAKRGDIGSTAQAYANAFLGDEANSAWGCDCLTVNPYLGDDSLQPFVERCIQTKSGIFVLVRTSNPGGKMLQARVSDGEAIYHTVGRYVQDLSQADLGENGYGEIGAVIGATHPDQLFELRQKMPNTIFLVPGFGAQGGSATDIA
ncbi:MAG: orotidine-5'-phosphate decarboxylase, partial [Planctomycetota bacterium]